MAKVTEKTKEAKVVNEKESKKVNKNVNESKIMKKNIKAQNKDELKSTEVVKKVEEIEKKEIKKTFVHTHIIIAAVGVLALLLSLFNSYQISKAELKTNNKTNQENQELGFESIGEDISYRIYAGLTDKQANYQLIDDDTAVSIVKTICVNNSVSYTIYPAQGGYKDKNGMIHTEKTLVLEMDHINEDDLGKILSDICVSLNISGVMITKQTQDVIYFKKN